MIKNLLIHFRSSMKIFILLAIITIIIVVLLSFIYKPIYRVTFKGEQIGYIQDKTNLQKRINDYIKKGEGDLVAFVDISELPTYTMCLLKKDIVTNDDEIFNKIKDTGITYYKYYAILEDNVEKFYVTKKEDAENIIEQLKEKKSTNKDKLGYIEKFENELKDFATVDKVVADLFIKPPVVQSIPVYVSNTNLGSNRVSLGMSLTTPVYGIVTSRFGYRSSGLHQGLDIGSSTGTRIVAAAEGTVTTASYQNGYGNFIVIAHENGVQTCYGHCNTILVSVGDHVEKGQIIGTVGSTGRSTGPHLHLEIRKNGVAQNPQNYLY